MVWYKLDFAKLTTEEIKTLKAKVLQLPTMSMEMFDSVFENIDENYPFSLCPTLILALLVSVVIHVIALGVISIWYRRKASLTSSTVGNLVKLVPSLNDKVPTLNSLLPILSEQASSKNKTMLTPTAVSTLPQTTPDELILPPVLIPQLQVATTTPSTSAKGQSIHLEPGPKQISKDVTTEPISLEMFNKATSDLNNKGIINLKKYN